MKSIKHPFDAAVVAQTHPSLYLMHKYWARKPHNVVRRYIEYYTEPGDTVLDPFMGSGVTVFEALRLKRKAIGVDLNPVACFIARMSLVPVDLVELERAYDRVSKACSSQLNSIYLAKCSSPRCKKEAIIGQTVWKRNEFKGDQLLLVKVSCSHCGHTEQRKPTEDDLARTKRIFRMRIPFFYPNKIPLHETAKRSVNFIHELFVHRALIALSILLHEIRKERDPLIRDLLLFCFSSNLAQMSKLNSIDMREGREFSSRGWVIPNYWVPQGYLETNVWNGFTSRFEKIRKGKKEAGVFCKTEDEWKVLNEDATKLSKIKTNSIDYVFTDPPYGDAVPYFGLSLMWAAWLQMDDLLDFDREVVVSERGDYEQELADYRRMLISAFAEMHRVLKPGGTVSVTFHNREIRVWNALVSAAFDAGFVYENDNYVLPAVKSSKSQLAKSGSMTGDIYINFRKPLKPFRQHEITFEEVNRIMTEEVKLIIQSRNGQATTDQLARGIYSRLISKNLFNKLQDSDIRKVLASLPIDEVLPNVWAIRDPEPESMLAYVPLYKRIEFIVDSVLESGKKTGYELDDFLVPIFTQLKNGLTPENKEILDVLRQRAQVKQDKWYPLKQKQIELLPEYEIPQAKPLLEEELREHEQFIYQLAQLGAELGYQVWVGKNEQNKSELLQRMSIRRLEIPGLSEKFISDNRIDQIDLLWLNSDQARYVAFEIENSTGVVPGVQRLANLTEKLQHLRIPTYVVIPDKFRSTAKKIFDSPSGRALGTEHRRVIVYSKLLHNIDLLKKRIIRPADLLSSIAEPA